VFKVGYQSIARWLPGCSVWFPGYCSSFARVEWIVSRALLGGLLMSSQITFIDIALFTIQIVSKQLYIDNRKIIQ